MHYVLGIDLGTSSLKGILMNSEGQLISEQSSEYPLFSPKPNYSQQNPADWILACEEVLENIAAEVTDFSNGLEGISFSGQMHSLVVLDEKNQPVYPSILWNDGRTSKQCRQINDRYGEKFLEMTGNIPLEGFTLPKILWLQENEPKVWEKVATILLPKDYLRYWFTGKLTTEYSDAAGTLLLDIGKQAWSTEIIEEFGISEQILPDLVPSFAEVGHVRSNLKQRFDFKQEVRVFAGGADNACAALGAGLVDDETGLLSIGTSGVLSSYESKRRDYDGKLHFFNHVLPDRYYSMGVTLAAGNSLSWFKDTFAKEYSFSELLEGISEISPGSDGLLFSPYIMGERTPHFDSKIHGSFIGITGEHSLAHFARAVLEGITFSLKDSQEIMSRKGKKFKRLISVGGGAKNPDWLQMQADILDTEILSLAVEQGPCAGACMIAALGCDWFDDSESLIERFVVYKSNRYKPNRQNAKQYQLIYQVWKKMYAATKEICHLENALQTGKEEI